MFPKEISRKRLGQNTHTHTVVLLLFWILSGTTQVSRYQKGKTNLDLLEQEIVSGSGICCAICNAYSLLQPWSYNSSYSFIITSVSELNEMTG